MKKRPKGCGVIVLGQTSCPLDLASPAPTPCVLCPPCPYALCPLPTLPLHLVSSALLTPCVLRPPCPFAYRWRLARSCPPLAARVGPAPTGLAGARRVDLHCRPASGAGFGAGGAGLGAGGASLGAGVGRGWGREGRLDGGPRPGRLDGHAGLAQVLEEDVGERSQVGRLGRVQETPQAVALTRVALAQQAGPRVQRRGRGLFLTRGGSGRWAGGSERPKRVRGACAGRETKAVPVRPGTAQRGVRGRPAGPTPRAGTAPMRTCARAHSAETPAGARASTQKCQHARRRRRAGRSGRPAPSPEFAPSRRQQRLTRPGG